VVSGADPRRTLLGLVDPIHLAPDVIQRLQHFRARGVLAKVNFAVGGCPRFPALASTDASEQRDALSGVVRLGQSIAAIERAFDAVKYGSLSDDPWIELTIPSVLDPALAPAGQHVVSAYVQYAPYQLRAGTWEEQRDRLGDVAAATIERYAPGFSASIIAREVITPVDLERTCGLTGGHIFHGEIALDQFFVTRPLLGWARYATPIRNLFLCGSGTHPGTGLDGRSGANASREILRKLRA
jgi:phytoene dehydrogenase-like protein